MAGGGTAERKGGHSGMKKNAIARVSALVLGWLLAAGSAQAGTIYYTSLNATDSTFAKYDTVTNSWTTLNSHFTSTQMAVSSSGELYSYNHQTNRIELYNPDTDSWSDVMAGPGIAPSFGNLEIDNAGRFLLTALGNANLYYSDGGGAWNAQALGFAPNAMGDYDPTTGQYVVGVNGMKDIVLIDTATFAQTHYIDAGPAGEHRRSGAILDNRVYEQNSNQPFTVWDLTAPGAAPTTMAAPGGIFWAGMAADRDNSILYMTDLYRGYLWKLEDGAYTQLATGPGIQNHSSIAYVGDAVAEVSEPAAAAILALGIAALGRMRRRRG
jgi:hypothetical protein